MPLTGKVVDMNLASDVELTSSLIEKLGRTLVELEAHKDASTDKVQWNDVEGHFHRLEAIMRKRLEELEAKEKKFKEKELVLLEKEAAVTAKEQDVLDQVQELKDAAVDAITEARANPLLKTYLKGLRKDLKGNGDPEIQNEYNARELNAVRTVIRCVKEYKLDAEYPLDPLRKRLVQLQNSIRDRKRKRDRGKRQQQSGSRGEERLNGTLARDPGGGRQGPPSFSERAPPPQAHTLLPEKYSPTLPSVYSYPVSTQLPYTAQTHLQIQSGYSYPVSSQPRYTAQAFDQSAYSYPVSSQPRYGNQTNDQRSNYYAQDPGVSASYSGAAPSYGAHMQQSHQPYL